MNGSIAAFIRINHVDGVGSDTNEFISGRLVITNFDEAAYSLMSGTVSMHTTSGQLLGGYAGGNVQYAANALTAIKLAFSTGNIAEGYMTVNKLD